MLQHEAKFEFVDLWLSYAGEDKEIANTVHQLLSSDTGCQLRCFIESREDINSEQHLNIEGRLKINVHQYKTKENEEDSNAYTYHLAAGADVRNLVHDISKHFLRVVILSESYFKKPVCMQELCMSLCSQHTKKAVYPLYLSLLKKPIETLLTESFDFAIPINANASATDNNPRTLAEALKQTHDFLRTEYKNIRGYDLSQKSAEDFQAILNDYSNKIFIQVSAPIDDAFIQSAIQSFVFDICKHIRNADWQTMLNKRFVKLLDISPLSLLMPQQASHEDALSLHKFMHINSATKVTTFLQCIENEVLKHREHFLSDATAKRLLWELCALVILKAVQSVNAHFYPHLGQVESLLPVYIESEQLDFHSELLAGFAYSIANDQPVVLTDVFDPFKADNASIKNIVRSKLPKSSANDINEDELQRLVKSLLLNIDPELIDEMPDADKLLESPDFVEELRAAIDHSMERKQMPAIAVRAEQERDSKGYYSILKSIDELLTSSGQPSIGIPVVELKLTNKPQDGLEVMFNKTSYRKFKKSLKSVFENITLQPA